MIFWAVTAVAAQNSIEIVVPCGADTPGLQSLIDEVSDKGGGRIVFPRGEYPTGQLELKSGVELHLEEGAVILGSTSPYDYHQVDTRQTAGDERNDKSQLGLIVAKNAHHIPHQDESRVEAKPELHLSGPCPHTLKGGAGERHRKAWKPVLNSPIQASRLHPTEEPLSCF